MPAPLDCPEIERWEALFGPAAPLDKRERFERHLESCAACQDRLDRVREGGEALLRLARQVGDPTATPADPTLVQVLDRLHGVKCPDRNAVIEPTDLYFLSPADGPGVLGTLGDYEVRQVIGQGGMGVVLKAFDLALHRLVAIKVMAPAVAGSATARRRFTREAQAAAAVSHENVVAVHGVHEKDGLPYLVMQYVDGESLQDRLDRGGPVELMEAVRIGLQTASGLAAAHAQGLIHRDIKPANLLLENGVARVKITDFGLARTVDDVQLTQNGVVAGTPEYMAPEQARGDPIDHRADLFSLGSVLYAMCTGMPPFRGSTAVAVLRQVSDQPAALVRSVNSEVPAWLEMLIARLLAKNPADRLQSANEVALLLEKYLAHLRQPATLGAPVLPPVAGNEPERVGPRPFSGFGGPSRPRLGLAVLVSVGVLGLGVALWFAVPVANIEDVPQPKESYAKEYYHSFKDNPEDTKDFELIGPNADECVKFEPGGLRIVLPAAHPGPRLSTGVGTRFAVKGDFEITLKYELLKEGQGSGLFLGVDLNTLSYNRASLTRGMRDSRQFLSWFQLSREGSDKPYRDELRVFPSAGTTARLRLVRTGSVLAHYVAEGEGDKFTLLWHHPFGAEDVRTVRLGGQTSGPLDARLIDVHVRADSLPDMPDIPLAAQEGGTKILLLLITFISFSALVFLAVRLYARRRGAMPAAIPASASENGGRVDAVPPHVSFACSSCGKKLRARPALAGKRLKCPHCGRVVLLPNITTSGPPNLPPGEHL